MVILAGVFFIRQRRATKSRAGNDVEMGTRGGASADESKPVESGCSSSERRGEEEGEGYGKGRRSSSLDVMKSKSPSSVADGELSLLPGPRSDEPPEEQRGSEASVEKLVVWYPKEWIDQDGDQGAVPAEGSNSSGSTSDGKRDSKNSAEKLPSYTSEVEHHDIIQGKVPGE